MSSNTLKARFRMPVIPGTKPSIKNAQLLMSTGIPSLDNIIGGGLPIGSILLVEEDTYGIYSKVIQKYFVAESIVIDHPLLIASLDNDLSQIISSIPTVATESEPNNDTKNDKDQMKIAWRYQNLRVIDNSLSNGRVFGHYYDLTKSMTEDEIRKADITQWSNDDISEEAGIFENSAYMSLLKTIHKTVRDKNLIIGESQDAKKVLRISIQSLGSRLWFSDDEYHTHSDLLKFLTCLKAILRNSYAVAVITIPANIFNNSDNIVERMEHLSDIAIHLESFADSPKKANPLFKDYHGLLNIKKLSALNILAPHCPESLDLAFKLRRKKFVIEILHLPPEFGDTVQREQDEIVQSTFSCSSSKGMNKLDF